MNKNRRAFLKSTGGLLASACVTLRCSSTGAMERRRLVDPETGVEIWQITSFPTVNENLYFHSRCWTADGRTFVFQSMSSPSREAAYDLYRADVDGTRFERLTHGEPWGNFALHPKKRVGYFVRGREFFTLDIETKAIAKVAELEAEGSAGGAPGSFTDDGRLYCFVHADARGRSGFGVLDTETNKTRVAPLGVAGKFTHLQIEPGKGDVVQFVGDGANGEIGISISDMNGKTGVLPFPDANGHNAWLGPSGRVYTNTLGATRDILVCAASGGKIETLAKAPPRFWHAGASPEGDWLVSDTSPDDGLYLVCAATGRSERLLRAGSSQGHSQYTHPHPSVSPGARHVLYNSDRTGIPHVYCAAIPDEMKKRLSA